MAVITAVIHTLSCLFVTAARSCAAIVTDTDPTFTRSILKESPEISSRSTGQKRSGSVISAASHDGEQFVLIFTSVNSVGSLLGCFLGRRHCAAPHDHNRPIFQNLSEGTKS